MRAGDDICLMNCIAVNMVIVVSVVAMYHYSGWLIVESDLCCCWLIVELNQCSSWLIVESDVCSGWLIGNRICFQVG